MDEFTRVVPMQRPETLPVRTGRALEPVKRAWRGLLLCACLVGFLAVPVATAGQVVQPPNRGGFTVSMGVPPSWRWHAGASVGVYQREEGSAAFYAHGGFYRDVVNPVTAGLGVMGEGYVGSRGSFSSVETGLDGGVRLGLHSPATRLGFGWDFNIRDAEADFYLSLVHPLRRGGIFTGGGTFRVDYLPGRGHSFTFGVQLPLGQRFLGKTRPRQDRVHMQDPEPPDLAVLPPADLREGMTQALAHAQWVTRLTVPYTDHWDGEEDRAMERFVVEMEAIRAHVADTRERAADGGVPDGGPLAEVEAYHHALDRAFSIATSPEPLTRGETTPLGIKTASAARAIVLEQILLPYNRLLGQKKSHDSTRGLGTAASAEFYEWLTRSEITRSRLRVTTWTFQEYLELVEQIRVDAVRIWRDSRYVWLPFQLALEPRQHDSQEELNELVERATGEVFTRGNRHWYLETEQFQAELTRMILEAEDYHVLWTHDFRGYDAEGGPDEMSFRQVVHAYLPALIDAVRAYDERGRMPQYLLFHDQLYFVANGNRLWIELLQDPLHHRIDLPAGFEAWEDSISGLQGELADAVADSELMQSQALHFEDGWIENVVKVHVNVTNPPDASFWTDEIFPFFMGLPDVVMRDHRKISFYDVTEADPYKGMAIYTGAGVGEHYVGAGWEDRAIMVQGPVLLSLKNAARQLLENQGFETDEIPWELRPRPLAGGYYLAVADTLDALGEWGWDMQLHNQIGFRFKPVSVAKATLYTLMPPGSVIKAPDSIWGSHFWASMLLGNALRGGRSLVIAPAIANAPSAGFPQMSRAQDVMTRLVVADEILGEEIERRGGLLKVGLFTSTLSTGDIPGKMLAFAANLERTPWLRDLYGFHPKVVAEFLEEARALAGEDFGSGYDIEQEHRLPKLHLKANYFATREAWDDLLSRDDISPPFRNYFREVSLQNQALAEGGYRVYDFLLEALLPPSHEILEDYMSGLTDDARERIALFFLLGSHNQNNRSMLLDGESAFVVAGWSSRFGLPDFLVIVGLTEWIDDLDRLEELFPGYTGIKRRISHWIRVVV